MLRYILVAICVSWCSQLHQSNGYFVSTLYPDMRPLELYNQAVHVQRQGEFLSAINVYLEALRYFPEFPEAHQNLGHLYETQKNFERSKYHHTMSVRHASSEEFNATAIVNLVLLEMRTNTMDLTKLNELYLLLSEAEQVSPTSTHVLFQQALLLEKMGQFQSSLNKLQRVIALDDRHAMAYLNIGNHYFRASNFEVASKFYKHSLDRLPGWDVYNKVLVLNNLGQCYRERGLLKDAYGAFTEALQSLATTQNTNSTSSISIDTGMSNMQSSSTASYNGGKYDGKAVHFWCLNNMYTIQGMMCDWYNFEHLEQRIELFLTPPSSSNVSYDSRDTSAGNFSNHSNSDQHRGEEYQLSSFKSDGVLLDAYTMSLLKYASRTIDRYVCEQSCPMQPVYDHPHSRSSPTNGLHRNSDHLSETSASTMSNLSMSSRKLLRVGYLSHDWRDHPMGRLTSTLVTTHHQQQQVLSTHTGSTGSNIDFNSHEGSQSGTYVSLLTQSRRDINVARSWKQRINATSLSYGANDRSSIRNFVVSNSAYFIELLDVKNDLAAAEIVHAQKLDIVVDLTAHTYNGRIDIVAARPAPIIINYLGFPGTTGCSAFDYSMVQAQIVPPEYASELFTERMLYLPYTYQSNDMLLRVAPPLCAENINGDATFAHSPSQCRKQGKLVQLRDEKYAPSDLPTVPKDALLVCSFNANKKMEPLSFRSWMQVLQHVPKAVLVLLSVSADVKNILYIQAMFYGVHPKRIVFIPKRQWKSHLIRSAECDIVLDTFVYGAHTTASDVLWMGVPLVSLRGFGSNRMPSRVAASITAALSLPKMDVDKFNSNGLYRTEPVDLLVVDSIQQYEDTAVRLLLAMQNVRTLLSNTILHRAVRSAAFDSELMQFSIETAYQTVYDARQLLLNINSIELSVESTATNPYISRMPHVILPSSAYSSNSTTKTWERKFARDVQQCCAIDNVDELFTHFNTEQHRVTAAFEICAQRLASHKSGEDSGCSVSDLHALVRRLITAYPTLHYLRPHYTTAPSDTFTTIVTAEDIVPADNEVKGIVEDVGLQHGSDTTTTSPSDSWKEPFDPNCAAALDLECAIQLFSATNAISLPKECSLEIFYEQVRSCYTISAPLVYDFLFAVQAKLVQNKQCTGEVAFVDFLRRVLFLSPAESSPTVSKDSSSGIEYTDAAAMEEALVQLRRVTSFSTYVSPLWRSLTAAQLRAVVTLALLPLYAGSVVLSNADERLSPKELFVQYLREYRVRVFASTNGNDSMGNTVCRAFLLAHHVSLHNVEEEYKHCEYVLRMQSARLLTEHSMCLQHQLTQTGVPSSDRSHFDMQSLSPMQRAVLSLTAAFALDPSDQRLLNVGTILMDARMPDIGFFLSSVAVMRMAKALPLPVVTPIAQAMHRSTNPPIVAAPTLTLPRVVFYCNEYGQGWWPGWGPSSLERPDNNTIAKGMGGSEEAVYYTSIELAKRGYEVIVYAGVTEADHSRVFTYTDTDSAGDEPASLTGSVTWLHYDYYNPAANDDTRCEVFVAWRYAISLGLSTLPRGAHHCNRKYLWLHDLIPGSILPPSFFRHFDNILVQSDFHKSFVYDAYVEHARAHALVDLQQVDQRISIVPNGISSQHPFDGVNDNNVFVYGSAPGRGLYLVLSQWKRIKTAIPLATLEIYYGFTESAMKELRISQGENFDAWFAQMQLYLQQDGVKYFGSVDHATLTAAYARAGFLLYPTTFQETGCITVLRAMACGAIPITSRLYPSVLHSLTEDYDLGPAPLSRAAAQDPRQLSQWLVTQWTPAVIAAYYRAQLLVPHRRVMKEDIQRRYSWAETANTFINLMDA